MTEYNHQEDEPMISDTALDDPALRDLFAELGALADRPTPPIGHGLAALFAGATPLAAARSRRNKAAKTGLIGLVTAGILAGGVTAAAAANELPAPAQRIVSRVINTLTPLEIPNPDEQGPVEHQTDTNIDDNGDQPGQDVDQPGQDGTEQGDQSDGQGSQSGGDQSGEPAGGSGDQGGSDGGADQQGSGQETTGDTTGESGDTGTSGNGSSGSGTTGGQHGTNGSGQN
ncbi:MULTISPECIES: hypothetical protein [unclassified Nocardioides]|uniref:hypothetical protein n=1 Tax=unclassified Nocardioides TaxID=2615069 RepID=UPI0009EFBBD7|nr:MULTISPECIES: hypothetical protein [unclassified Nocardioides]GAW48963.1 hypothetical protein PD653B2_1282 [Nocardioides sp. PD653-B2]GAW55178.1 hypothetical protein PD653_2597 [Nocardioides sp. PD653]